jgi:hypothetical protein
MEGTSGHPGKGTENGQAHKQEIRMRGATRRRHVTHVALDCRKQIAARQVNCRAAQTHVPFSPGMDRLRDLTLGGRRGAIRCRRSGSRCRLGIEERRLEADELRLADDSIPIAMIIHQAAN